MISDHLKSVIISWDYPRIQELFVKENVLELANYVHQLVKILFPKLSGKNKGNEKTKKGKGVINKNESSTPKTDFTIK